MPTGLRLSSQEIGLFSGACPSQTSDKGQSFGRPPSYHLQSDHDQTSVVILARKLWVCARLSAPRGLASGTINVCRPRAGLAVPLQGGDQRRVDSELRPVEQGKAVHDDLNAPPVGGHHVRKIQIAHEDVSAHSASRFAADPRRCGLQWVATSGKHTCSGTGSAMVAKRVEGGGDIGICSEQVAEADEDVGEEAL